MKQMFEQSEESRATSKVAIVCVPYLMCLPLSVHGAYENKHQ